MRGRPNSMKLFVAVTFILISFSVSWGGGIEYTYDDLNRLIKVKYGDGTIIEYGYDAVGNRLEKAMGVGIPSGPSNLAATIVSSSQINLEWTDNSDIESGFRVERKIGGGGTYSEIGTVGVNSIAYPDPTVSPETIYCYRVRAYNANGYSVYSNEVIVSISTTSWTPTWGASPSPPVLAWNPIAEEMQVVVRGGDDSIWKATFNGNGVFNNDWSSIPGATPSSPALAWNPATNNFQMVVRDSNSLLWAATFNLNGAFNNNWTPIPGTTPSSSALVWHPEVSKLILVVRHADDSIWMASFNSYGTFNNDWTSISGATPSTPALAWNPVASKLQMVVRGSDNSLWVSSFNSAGTFNNDWTSISGGTPSSPALAWNPDATGPQRLRMVVRGSDNSLWVSSFNSSGTFNNDWASLPGATPSSPAIAWNPGINMFQIGVRASNDLLWKMLY